MNCFWKALILEIIFFVFLFIGSQYVLPRDSYVKLLLVGRNFGKWALYAILYSIVGFCVWSILGSHVIYPFLNAVLVLDDDVAEEGPATGPPQPPHDAESLVSVPETRSNHGVRGFLATMDTIFTLAAFALVSAAFVRPEDSGILIGTYQALERVVRHVGISVVVVVGPPLILFAPTLIIWTIVKRLSVEPHKAYWSRALRVFRRIYIGTFLYLLAIEGFSSYQPFIHLIWQAEHLSRLFRWIGLAAYSFGVLWLLTDTTTSYFLYRGLALLLSKPVKPPGPPHTLANICVLLLLPIAMLCNSYLYAAKGLASAALAILRATGGVLAVFVFDFCVYWTYYFWPNGQDFQLSAVDLMAIELVGFTIRDASGKTQWDRNWESEREARTAGEKLESAPAGPTEAEKSREPVVRG
ncbi:hypothetical protein K438DRAFT_1840399 [Mycena galopus ATCC 62051]|nr:hypothetical protein K438DRAFT_1840399 [Mycena galopus ATCC 62051]